MRRTAGLAALAALIATIFIANWLVNTYGVVPVGFGLMAPAAVFAAGFALTFRDLVHRTLGRAVVFLAIIIGAACSALVSPHFAVASGVAFLVSELADLLVYSRIAERSFIGGVFASNVVGLTVDSLLFLWLAFGSLAFLPGQMLGKFWTTLAAIVLLAGARAAAARSAPEAA